eukprot:COSAG04_NODE_6826_length_1247_cov_4.547909_1_plen_92_part_01
MNTSLMASGPEPPPEPRGEAVPEPDPAGEYEEEEERILGPLGGAGLVALVGEVLCGCAGAAGCVAMIWLGIECLAGGEGEGEGEGAAGSTAA